MGVKEAPSAPAAPSMGVEEVTATPLEQIMVCVIGVEEPPPASVGVNIYASSPGRAQDLDFSSLPRTTSVRRWRNISGKKFAIGLVFVAIVLAIGLTVALLSKSCCAPTPAEDFNVGTPTETPAEAPTVAAMTLAPTTASVNDATLATTTTASTLGTGTGADNPCIVCSNGTDVDKFVPGADDGDFRTCADLIDEANMYETGSNDCKWFEFKEFYCCYTIPDNPCNICLDGATASAVGDFAPGANDGDFRTCADLIDEAKLYETGSNDCEWLEMYTPDCCFTPP